MATQRLQKAADLLKSILAESISAGEIPSGSPEEKEIRSIIDGLETCTRTDLDEAVWADVISITSSLNGFGLDAAVMLQEEGI